MNTNSNEIGFDGSDAAVGIVSNYFAAQANKFGALAEQRHEKDNFLADMYAGALKNLQNLDRQLTEVINQLSSEDRWIDEVSTIQDDLLQQQANVRMTIISIKAQLTSISRTHTVERRSIQNLQRNVPVNAQERLAAIRHGEFVTSAQQSAAVSGFVSGVISGGPKAAETLRSMYDNAGNTFAGIRHQPQRTVPAIPITSGDGNGNDVGTPSTGSTRRTSSQTTPPVFQPAGID